MPTNIRGKIKALKYGVPEPPGNYMGGTFFKRAKQQFQMLYEELGTFQRALQLAERLILWPDHVKDAEGKPRRPTRDNFWAWAVEVDDGTAAPIPDRHRQIFLKRLRNSQDDQIRAVVQANAEGAIALAGQAKDGTLPPEKSSQLLHLNNGVSWVTHKALPPASAPVQQTNINRLVLNTGAPPLKKLKPAKKGTIVEAVFERLPEEAPSSQQ